MVIFGLHAKTKHFSIVVLEDDKIVEAVTDRSNLISKEIYSRTWIKDLRRCLQTFLKYYNKYKPDIIVSDYFDQDSDVIAVLVSSIEKSEEKFVFYKTDVIYYNLIGYYYPNEMLLKHKLAHLKNTHLIKTTQQWKALACANHHRRMLND